MGAAAATTKPPRKTAGSRKVPAKRFASLSDGSGLRGAAIGGGACENLSRRLRAAPVNAMRIQIGTHAIPITATPKNAFRQPKFEASATESGGHTAEPRELPM